MQQGSPRRPRRSLCSRHSSLYCITDGEGMQDGTAVGEVASGTDLPVLIEGVEHSPTDDGTADQSDAFANGQHRRRANARQAVSREQRQ